MGKLNIMKYFVVDHTNLKYNKPWSVDFPFCSCGTITANSLGTCTGCLTGVPWNLERTTVLTQKITEEWEIFVEEDGYT